MLAVSRDVVMLWSLILFPCPQIDDGAHYSLPISGPPAEGRLALGCRRFSQEYVDALKGLCCQVVLIIAD